MCVKSRHVVPVGSRFGGLGSGGGLRDNHSDAHDVLHEFAQDRFTTAFRYLKAQVIAGT